MDRRLFPKGAFGASMVAGLGGCVNAQKSVSKRPNIVYVFADQMRYVVFGHLNSFKIQFESRPNYNN